MQAFYMLIKVLHIAWDWQQKTKQKISKRKKERKMQHKKDNKSQTTIDIISFTFNIWKNLYLVPKKLQKTS